jgi:hypothetical protein
MGAMPFKGAGISGYDNVKKKFCNVWVDSMSTGMMITEGTREGNVLNSAGTVTDPMTGKDCQVKEVSTLGDDDHMKHEMWMSMPDGKMMKMMEVNYTRKK